MQYTYEFEMWRGEFGWIAEPFGLDGITQGESIDDLSESAADLLREIVRDHIMSGHEMPAATFGNDLTHDGIRLIVSVDAAMSDIPKISAAEAARELNVSRPRVTAMLGSGLLDGWKEGRNTWVTLASVEARKADSRKAGRPKTKSVSATSGS